MSAINPLTTTIGPYITIFPNAQVPECPLQELYVSPPINGVYGYYCEPSRGSLLLDPACWCAQQPKEEPQEQEQPRRQPVQNVRPPIPVIPPVVVSPSVSEAPVVVEGAEAAATATEAADGAEVGELILEGLLLAL